MSLPALTPDEMKSWNDDGYLFVPNLLDAEEVDLLLKISKRDKAMQEAAWDRSDSQGGTTKLTLWNELEDKNIYSAIVRSHRIVDRMEQMLGDEVYHYHHKMMLKEPRTGGAWEWHQDYGYWYNNGCLFPYMASVMIAVDRASKENGCLKVIRGSHHMGRIEHGLVGVNKDQTGADLERVDEALKRMELVYCEMEPGTALFFHGNLLHASDMNTSEFSRWTLICCYNAKCNDPYKQGGHPGYSYLEKWPDSRIKEIGREQWDAMQAMSI